MPSKLGDEIIYSFPNFNGAAVEVWEWIRNISPHFIMDVIAYPCWNLSLRSVLTYVLLVLAYGLAHERKCLNYRKTSIISRTLVGNKIVDNSDVVGASPVGAAPTTSSFSTEHLASMDLAKTTARGDKKHLSFGIWCDLY